MGLRPSGSFSRQLRYGHDPDYAWVQGKLEYSHIDRRWKLRYIPIDGTTDQFGGSVVLAGLGSAVERKAGDFVRVHGEVKGRFSEGDENYAPQFEVARIERL